MSSAQSARGEITDPIAIRALEVIRRRAHESTLTRAVVAAELDIAESTLAHHLARATGWSFFEHVGLERVRIVEAGLLERSKPVRLLMLEPAFRAPPSAITGSAKSTACRHSYG